MKESSKSANPGIRGIGSVLFRFFSSYGLAAVVLLLLGFMIWVGTLEQVDQGLYEVQRRYFDSLFALHWLDMPNPFSSVEGATFPIAIPLPGVYLLMGILMINLICGAVIRARKGWKQSGILIAHSSMILLIVAGWVSFHFKKEGNMALYENQSSNVFRSYTEWSIEIAEAGQGAAGDVVVIEDHKFEDLGPGESREFAHASLPFDVRVSGYVRNAVPVRSEVEPPPARVPSVDGFHLRTLPLAKEEERNVSGVHVVFEGSNVTAGREALLWGMEVHPHTVEAGGKLYTATLVRRGWAVPFTVRLDKFTRKLHPGTGIAKEYSSEVTKTEGGVDERIKIEMNKPLRHEGFTFFQASWGPENARPGEALYSVFAVVKNPSDQWPLYACILVGIGLLIHFGIKLMEFIVRSNRTASGREQRGPESGGTENGEPATA